MKRQDYESPTTHVVQLKPRYQILTGSDPDAVLNGMEKPEDL